MEIFENKKTAEEILRFHRGWELWLLHGHSAFGETAKSKVKPMVKADIHGISGLNLWTDGSILRFLRRRARQY
jgi:hypothetical protein